MGRAERRLAEKKGKSSGNLVTISKETLSEKVYEELSKERDKIANEVTDKVVKIVKAACVITLADKFDFTKDQLNEFHEEVDKQAECALAGLVEVDEFLDICEKELKVKLKEKE